MESFESRLQANGIKLSLQEKNDCHKKSQKV